jgi:adenine-specific DNA-methyltransferase
MTELEKTKRDYFKEKLDRIPAASFNTEQKKIAESILDSAPEEDLDKVYGLITQRIKTGFVFDMAPEVNHNCVALAEENPELNINADKILTNQTEHTLIIGENYDALKNLCAAYIDKNYNGLIDVIYIDPPYNTEKTKEEGNDYKTEVEASKFVYRDKFTRDGWLNMMNERLKLARRLLSDKGVIFISIDDSEQAYLKVLCDEVFGEGNFVTQFIWEKKRVVQNDAKFSNTNHEYILAYRKSTLLENFDLLPRTEDMNARYSNPDNDPRGDWTSVALTAKSGSNIYEMTFENGVSWKPNEGTYPRLSKESLITAYNEGRLWFGSNGKNVPRLKKYLSEVKNGVIINSIIDNESGGSTQFAKEQLKRIVNSNIFETPKPTTLIKILLKLRNDKNSTILDFFAGSGTTGQAVMELNEADGGNRKCILITNNENNIALNVTRERLFRVITGKGSKGEEIKWEYSNDKKSLENNTFRVFEIKHYPLTLQDLDKADKLAEKAQKEFTKLNPAYKKQNEFDIYNELAALNPYNKNNNATD